MRCPHLNNMKEVTEEDVKALELRAQESCDKCKVSGPDHLWACLQKCCTFVGCGRYDNRHIELHNQETEHHLCVELKDYRVWCFSCHSEVDPNSGSSCDEPLRTANTKETLNLGDSSELERELKPRGLCGLTNIGNTCYMNAALQALSNCPPLTQFFLENCFVGLETSNTNAGVAKNYCNLVTEMWSKKRPKYVVPRYLFQSVRSINGQFRGYGQQDAQEFLRCIMDQLHEELKQPVFTLPVVEQLSEIEEPVHQAKRLLGGTSSPTRDLDEGDGDIEMISDDEGCNEKLYQASPISDSIHSQQQDVSRTEVAAEPERKASTTLDPRDVQLVQEEEEENMSVEEMEDKQSLIKDQPNTEALEMASSDSQMLVDSEQSAAGHHSEDGTKEEKEVMHWGTSPLLSQDKLHGVAANTEISKKVTQAEKPKVVNYKSIITDIFDGKVQSSVQCLTCKRVSSRIETFQDLSLPIPGKDELSMIHAAQCAPLITCTTPAAGEADMEEKRGWVVAILDWLSRWIFGPQVTLQDCLAAFFSADELKGDNMYSCERCKKLRNGIKYCKVTQLPEILCIHLKRFRHEMYFSSKISNFITFPLVGLDMRPFLLRDTCGDINQHCTNYDLVAVISHHGSVGAGHYVAFGKNCISGKWYEFNDSWVSEVSDSHVSGVEAYVLFYRKSSDKAVRERKIFSNMMKENEGSPFSCYISKQWLTRFQHCAEPGPVTNTDFLCAHGAVHPFLMEKIQDLVVTLPSSVLEYLISRFGGGPPVSVLEMCEHCKNALEELERRRDYEIETFKKLNEQFLQNDNLDAYCISMRWFRSWEMFVKGNKDDPPGAIDNKHIVATKGNQKMLRGGSDYGQVSKETWNFLHNIYGGGPVHVVEAEQSQQ